MSRTSPASIRTRLKQRADAQKQDFNLILTRYGLERLLYRLSISAHANNFLLKGALLFSLWYDTPHRPTRDADLLGFGASDIQTIEGKFREICAIAVEDAIRFDLGSVSGSPIRKDAGYGGVRIDARAELDRARITLQVDIGFGDIVTPAAQEVTYPVLLDDLPKPRLRAYPKETVVAEKFHALCLLGMANSRMKDYFDLALLLRDEELDPKQLRSAIEATFARRQMPLPERLPTGLSDAFANDAAKQQQWAAFLRKNKLSSSELGEVVALLRVRFRQTELI
jgi:hypothetical protein